MFLAHLTADVLPFVLHTLQSVEMQVPEDEDVKAGWTAFGIFGLGILAVGLLGRSLYVQLRKVERARQDGVYGPVEPDPDGDAPAGSVAGDAGSGEPQAKA